MEEGSQLVDALEDETAHSMTLFGELEMTRVLILDIVAALVQHGKIGHTWRRLFSNEVLGDIETVVRGDYLTEEMQHGEEKD